MLKNTDRQQKILEKFFPFFLIQKLDKTISREKNAIRIYRNTLVLKGIVQAQL
jgi:hypothetical protein